MLVENDSTLSNILGWVSIACWIVVYSPQLYENYSLQSGEGLSALFVIVWLIGDICNLFGALLANLLPTVIILAIYYTVCDLTLLSQIYYYRWKNTHTRPDVVDVSAPEETRPLLVSSEARGEATIPPGQTRAIIARYLLALGFVFGVGIAAWWVSEHMSWDEGTTKPPTGNTAWMVQVLGWTSAVLYLGARFPQILKNVKTRCEGLSPALFFFSIFGNVTYAGSILAKSLELPYLLTNAGWLAGSILTVFLDVIVLVQFVYYVGRR